MTNSSAASASSPPDGQGPLGTDTDRAKDAWAELRALMPSVMAGKALDTHEQEQQQEQQQEQLRAIAAPGATLGDNAAAGHSRNGSASASAPASRKRSKSPSRSPVTEVRHGSHGSQGSPSRKSVAAACKPVVMIDHLDESQATLTCQRRPSTRDSSPVGAFRRATSPLRKLSHGHGRGSQVHAEPTQSL